MSSALTWDALPLSHSPCFRVRETITLRLTFGTSAGRLSKASGVFLLMTSGCNLMASSPVLAVVLATGNAHAEIRAVTGYAHPLSSVPADVRVIEAAPPHQAALAARQLMSVAADAKLIQMPTYHCPSSNQLQASNDHALRNRSLGQRNASIWVNPVAAATLLLDFNHQISIVHRPASPYFGRYRLLDSNR